MRIVRELQHEGIKITCFQLEHKYLVKYEWGPQEITYKFKMGDGLNTVPELENLVKKHLSEAAVPVLHSMRSSRLKVVDSYFNSSFEFDTII